jgi:hypothetical protein
VQLQQILGHWPHARRQQLDDRDQEMAQQIQHDGHHALVRAASASETGPASRSTTLWMGLLRPTVCISSAS